MSDQVSHPYKTTGKIAVLYILIMMMMMMMTIIIIKHYTIQRSYSK